MNMEQAMAYAKECGFEYMAPIDMEGLRFREEVREMCTAELCENYNTSWCCPPAIMPLEEFGALVMSYAQGLLVQTVGMLEDEFDYESLGAAGEKHRVEFVNFNDVMLENNKGESLSMSVGGCTLCEKCTYPDEPCCHPDKMIMSLGASGMLVNELCTKNGLEYNNGEKTITFTSCCFFN